MASYEEIQKKYEQLIYGDQEECRSNTLKDVFKRFIEPISYVGGVVIVTHLVGLLPEGLGNWDGLPLAIGTLTYIFSCMGWMLQQIHCVWKQFEQFRYTMLISKMMREEIERSSDSSENSNV